jgi:hypothetical protein
MAREPQTGGLEVFERENGNTTDPNANQTDLTYADAIPPKPSIPEPRAPRADEEMTVLGWIRKKQGPLA